jgi:hypothetical protein
MPAEESDVTDQLEQQMKATLPIYKRLCERSPNFLNRARQSEFHRRQESHGGNNSPDCSKIAGISLS